MGCKTVYGLMAAIALISGCKQQELLTQVKGIHNRPATQDIHLTTLILKNPPVLSLSSESREQGINDLENEQNEIEDLLADISSEIQIIYRYKMLLNGFAVQVPNRLLGRFDQFIKSRNLQSQESQTFSRIKPIKTTNEPTQGDNPIWGDEDSIAHIGVARLREKHELYGSGLRVGIIDTGVDYTHKMFGGTGTKDAYEQNDPNKVEGDFPTPRVVGGYDFCGSDYDAGSPLPEKNIPHPDNDPLDEDGHGSHVAGTVAGVGYDQIAYSGAAPQADIYALKVFGAMGSTSDSVVIAALEYAADPNGDLDPEDHLDVVNLSLGSSYGTQSVSYETAIRHLTKAGTLVVASAGNSGNQPYIVGSPSIANDALSVANSIDAMAQNWVTKTVGIKIGQDEIKKAPLLNASFTPPAQDSGLENQLLVAVGLATEPLPEDLATQVKDKVALIERGEVSFCDKAKHAQNAGAIGFVVYNNVDDDPFGMGGDCEIDIPGVMISQKLGIKIKDALKVDPASASVTFSGIDDIERPELIDTLAGSSSRGPRFLDAWIKPEIAAPGTAIVSASMGTGHETVQLTGTSMAAPHVTGAALLLKELYPNLTALELKALLISGSKPISDADDRVYPISRQGAGLIQIDASAGINLLPSPATLSLGFVNSLAKKTLLKRLELRNPSKEERKYLIKYKGDSELVLRGDSYVTLAPESKKTVWVRILISPKNGITTVRELNGHIEFLDMKSFLKSDIPVMAIVRPIAYVKASSLKIEASSFEDAEGALTTLKIENMSRKPAKAMLFNPLAFDDRKVSEGDIPSFCDLESAGYRLGQERHAIEFGYKSYQSMAKNQFCEASIQFDINRDGKADYELLSNASLAHWLDDDTKEGEVSILIDVAKAKKIKHDFEGGVNKKLDYRPAMVSYGSSHSYEHSSVGIMGIDLNHIISEDHKLRIKFALLSWSPGSEPNDFLDKQETEWLTISPDEFEMPYLFTESDIELGAYDQQEVQLIKGPSVFSSKNQPHFGNDLLIYIPHNAGHLSTRNKDGQSILVTPTLQD